MSYGMMICVQLDKRDEFDKIWRWAKTHMLYTSGRWKGYFAWQCNPDGSKIGGEPSCATDGEVYFIMSLYFASHRWGDGGAFNYAQEARTILKDVMSKDGSQGVFNMFNTAAKLISFVPSDDGSWLHTDPSYNLPAFSNYGQDGLIRIRILVTDSGGCPQSACRCVTSCNGPVS